jgi:hypothetical protein
MSAGLSAFARKFLLDEAATRAELDCPVLVWEAPRASGADEFEVITSIVSGLEDALQGATPPPGSTPTSAEPLVFPLRKAAPDASGRPEVTLGRADRNDLVLADPSVSRHHASFHRDARTGNWKVMDAGSSNGTWLGSFKLPPQEPAFIPDQSVLRFGNIEVTFYSPRAFFEYLGRMMNAPRLGEEPDLAPLRDAAPPEPLVLLPDELDALLRFYSHTMAAFAELGERVPGPHPALERAYAAAHPANQILTRLDLIAAKRRS